jgi:hypothetical protein
LHFGLRIGIVLIISKQFLCALFALQTISN